MTTVTGTGTVDDFDPYEEGHGRLYQPAYEGSVASFREQQRNLQTNNPDLLAANELAMLQMRTANAIRNNSYARTALDKHLINLNAISVSWFTKSGKRDDRMQEYWDEFAANPSLDGYGNLGNVQSVWHASLFQSGNAFTRYQYRKTATKIPLKLELILSETHDLFYFGTDLNKKIRHGIEFEDTKPKNYFFREDIYNQLWLNTQSNPFTPIIIPADEIQHMFYRDYPTQWIGVPKLAAVLIPLYAIDDLIDASVAKQQAAQAISWVIENTNPVAMTPTGTAVIKENKKTGKKKVIFNARGTNTQYLDKGEKIHFYQSTDLGTNLIKLIGHEVRRVASVTGVPYHSITGDLEGIDFSSLRALAIEVRERVEYIHNFMTIPLGMWPLAIKARNLAALYDKRVQNSVPKFQLPRRFGIDELKDAQADLIEVQSGFTTLQRILDERNMTFEELEADLKKRQTLKSYGIDLSSKQAEAKQSQNIEGNSNSSSN